MADNEFMRLEKAEQEVLAQIAQQKRTCDNLRAEFEALRDSFVGSYNSIFLLLQRSLTRLRGDEWGAREGSLSKAIAACAPTIKDSDTSEDIGKLQSSLKTRTKEALGLSDSSVNMFEEMSSSLRKLEGLAQGKGVKDFLDELQVKKQRLEKEEETLKGLQDRYDRYFGERSRKK